MRLRVACGVQYNIPLRLSSLSYFCHTIARHVGHYYTHRCRHRLVTRSRTRYGLVIIAFL